MSAIPAPLSDACAASAKPRRINRVFSPAHLQAVAHLYGLNTPSPRQAKVLFLGCGAGANLLPFAINHPQAQAIGIDIDPDAIAHGQQLAQQIGVANLQLFALDIATLIEQPELGQFDYILIGGAFSLADSATRQRILGFCERNLAPEGIACFEYGTYPSGKVRDVVRDALMLHASLTDGDSVQQLDSARAMLAFLHQGLASANPLAQPLRELIAQAEGGDDVELALKYLQQGLNEPCYFVEFNDQATQAGLCYVGDAQPHLEVPAAWGGEVDRLCQTINPARNKVLGQQYLDFLCNRACRHSLLTKQSRAADVLPEPDLDRLQNLRWAGYFKRVACPEGNLAHTLSNGDHIHATNEYSRAILDALGYAWPFSLDMHALRQNAVPPLDRLKAASSDTSPNPDAQALSSLKALFLKLGDQLRYTREIGPYDEAGSRHLQCVAGAGPAIRGQDATAAHRVPMFNLWHDEVRQPLATLDQRVLQGLDGHTSLGGLMASLPPSDAAVQTSLDTLHRLGLLNGDNAAWVAYWKRCLNPADCQQGEMHALCALLMRALPADRGGLNRYVPRSVPIPPRMQEIIKQVRNLADQKKPAAALALSQQLTRDYATHPAAWAERYRTLLFTNQQDDILEAALRAITLQHDNIEYYCNAANACYRLSWVWSSMHLNQQVLRGAPDQGFAWIHLGNYLHMQKSLADAELCQREALRCNPTHIGTHGNLANTLSSQGKFQEARHHYEQEIARSPNDFVTYSNLLFNCLHDGDLSAQDLFRLHRQFGQRVESSLTTKVAPSFANRNRNPDRPLRIGFVSGDLRTHAVAHFIEPYWTHLDKTRFQIHAYSNSHTEDAVSQRLRAQSHVWHTVAALDDRQLVKLIADESIDILFDLSGHTGFNRLPVFAYKPAPIQMTWIGYPGTTGLSAMDYLIIRRNIADPGVLDDQFTEKLIYLDIPLLFQPHPDSPEVSPLPCLEGKPFTFGSFNRPQKLSDDILKTWADILHATPGSRLLQGAMEAGAESGLARCFMEKMAAFGVPEDRIILKSHQSLDSYLAMHAEVDVLLDTFPYTGGTTTNHALWMGVPTITLAGTTLVSLAGASRMRQWQLDDFVAHTREEYVACAVKWFGCRNQLAGIRRTLRQRIETGSSKDNVTAARKLENALRQAWQNWCAGQPAKTLVLD